MLFEKSFFFLKAQDQCCLCEIVFK